MEAMATGLPVITTPTSGTVIRHNKEGFLHPYHATDALASSIALLAGDPSLRATMSVLARERAEHFNLNQYSAGLSSLMTQLLTG